MHLDEWRGDLVADRLARAASSRHDVLRSRRNSSPRAEDRVSPEGRVKTSFVEVAEPALEGVDCFAGLGDRPLGSRDVLPQGGERALASRDLDPGVVEARPDAAAVDPALLALGLLTPSAGARRALPRARRRARRRLGASRAIRPTVSGP
jgi:hypothetical protein